MIVRMERRAGIAFGILLVCCPCASALNPSLDINQYAHTAWTIRDGFFSSPIQTIAQTPDGYSWDTAWVASLVAALARCANPLDHWFPFFGDGFS
jgi:hypothetical protein